MVKIHLVDKVGTLFLHYLIPLFSSFLSFILFVDVEADALKKLTGEKTVVAE